MKRNCSVKMTERPGRNIDQDFFFRLCDKTFIMALASLESEGSFLSVDLEVTCREKLPAQKEDKATL